MLTAPRSIAICLFLLFGVGRELYLQAGPAGQSQSRPYMPPGSPSCWIGQGGQLLAPVEYDEHGIRKPAPRGAVGIRGFPSEAEIAAANPANAAQVAARTRRSGHS